MSASAKVCMWLGEQGLIHYEVDGQTMAFPSNDTGRIVGILRDARDRARPPVREVLRDLARESRAREWAVQVRERGAEIRADEERRKAKAELKRRGLIKRANKAKREKDLDRELAAAGIVI